MKVITAYAEVACGPGWANRPVWVVYKDDDGKLKLDCIQPEDQTAEMHYNWNLSATINAMMVKEAEKVLKKKLKIK